MISFMKTKLYFLIKKWEIKLIIRTSKGLKLHIFTVFLYSYMKKHVMQSYFVSLSTSVMIT